MLLMCWIHFAFCGAFASSSGGGVELAYSARSSCKSIKAGCQMNMAGEAVKRLSYRRPRMTVERRGNTRTNLCVPVLILPPDASVPIQTQTENVSVDGFLCYTQYFFSPGDRVKVLLLLPPAAAETHSKAGVCIYGEAEITRVTVEPTCTRYGIGCRLSTYRVLPDCDVLAADEMIATLLQSSPS